MECRVSSQWCTAELPVQCGCVQRLTGVTVGGGTSESGLVKPIYRNISYSQLGIRPRPENIVLATTRTGGTLRSYKYLRKTRGLQMSWDDWKHSLIEHHQMMVWFDVPLSPSYQIVIIGIDRSPSNNVLNTQLTQSYHVSPGLFQLFKWDLPKLHRRCLQIFSTFSLSRIFSSTNQMRFFHKTSKKVKYFRHAWKYLSGTKKYLTCQKVCFLEWKML